MDDQLMDSNPYWKPNIILMKCVGVWPLQKNYVKIPLRIMAIAAVCAVSIPQVIRGFEEWGRNTLIVIETIAGFFLTGSAIVKIVSAIVCETELKHLYQKIMNDWKTLKEDGEQKILREVGNISRLLTVIYTAYTIITGILFVAIPAVVPLTLNYLKPQNVSRLKAHCMFGEYFVDQQEYYYQIAALNCLGGVGIIGAFTTIDTTYISCVQHAVGLFKIVNYHLNKAFVVALKKNKSNLLEVESTIHSYVLQSLKIHRKSIEFSEDLQATFTAGIFFTMGATLMILSLGTVDVMLNIEDIPNFLRLSSMWLSTIVYLFYLNVPGQQIIDSSSNIFYAVYFCGWNEFPLKTQKILIFMMARSMKPCQFTAGPFLTMNLATCGLILRTAMSYFTFVLSLN